MKQEQQDADDKKEWCEAEMDEGKDNKKLLDAEIFDLERLALAAAGPAKDRRDKAFSATALPRRIARGVAA